jgi:tetratricopeptide (TPR) repeat protein
MRRSVTKGLMLATALGVAAWPATASRDATLHRPAELPDAECIGFLGGQEATGGVVAANAAQTPPVLMDGLGYAGLEPDSRNEEARAWFAQGVRLVWAFDEVEAIRAFQQAQRADPNCAMCFFGEAWARGPTINLQPRTEELAAARTAAQRAQALSANLSARDRLLVEAMVLRTGGSGSGGDAFRNGPYAAFMETQALRHPQDDMLSIMAADARMITWDDDNEPRPGSLAQRFLERVLARNPDHGGAIHYYIHLTDWIDRQNLAVPYAERLGRIAPAASHLVHMPSHTFYGVGRYADAARVNVQAVAADQAFRTRARPAESDYRYGLNAHNMHFAIESALARGDGATATEMSRQYRETYLSGPRDQRTAMLGTATYYTAGLHGDVAALLARPMPDHVFDRAQLHYARGEALARRGDAGGVRAEAAAIAALREGRDSPGLGRRGGQLAKVFQHVLEGRAAMLAGDAAAAQRAYRAAMEIQLAGNFGMDPPLFWYSIRRSLAAATLAGGDAQSARAQIYASLRRWPNDALALYVLAQADRAAGDNASAERNLARARMLWAGDLAQVPLARI